MHPIAWLVRSIVDCSFGYSSLVSFQRALLGVFVGRKDAEGCRGQGSRIYFEKARARQCAVNVIPVPLCICTVVDSCQTACIKVQHDRFPIKPYTANAYRKQPLIGPAV
jgi:hypothetical protein